MPNIRLSSESLKFYKQAKNLTTSQNYKPFVSFVHDEDESDNASTEDDVPAVVLTPRLKAHSRKINQNYTDDYLPGLKALQTIPVTNLSKRFSSSSLNTPSRILQLALEKKSSSDNDNSEGIDVDDEHFPEQTGEFEDVGTNKKRKVRVNKDISADVKPRQVFTRKKANQDKETEELALNPEIQFKAPMEVKKKNNAKKAVVDTTEGKVRRGRNKKTQLESENVSSPGNSAPSSETSENLESPVMSAIVKRTKRGRKKTPDSSVKDLNELLPPSKLQSVKVTVETRSSSGIRRDVSLVSEVSTNERDSKNVDDTIDNVVSNSVRNRESSATKPTKPSQNEHILLTTFDEHNQVPKKTFVTTRRTRATKAAEKSVPKGKRNNPKQNKESKINSSVASTITPNLTVQSNFDSISSHRAIPEFCSDDEEDRSPSDLLSRRSPILIKSNRLAAAYSSNLSGSYDDPSDRELSPKPIEKSSAPERTPSTSPDIFISPNKLESKKQEETFSPSPTKTKTSLESSNHALKANSAKIATRARRRASVPTEEVAAKLNGAPPTPSSSDQATPIQLQAVGLVRKSTSPNLSRNHQTPPRKVLSHLVTTPLSSRAKIYAPTESSLDNQAASEPIKRKQPSATPQSSKRSRFSPRFPSPQKLTEQQNINDINTEETLPCTPHVLDVEKLGIRPLRPSTLPETMAESLSDENLIEDGNLKGANTVPDGALENVSVVQSMRFNPYMAPLEDPVRARLLMATEEHRVSWLYILPNCSFCMRIYVPTTIMVISGNITIRSDRNQKGLVLNARSRIAEFTVGFLCQAINTGDKMAIFQVTEMLQ